jgi:hypothetical protein
MSAQQLADRTAELGMPIPRSVLANLESGRRDTVTVAEVLILAAALNVAPLELIFPVGYAGEVEMVPGRPSDPVTAMRWFTGELKLDAGDGETTLRQPVSSEQSAIDLIDYHDRVIGLLRAREADTARALADANDATDEKAMADARYQMMRTEDYRQVLSETLQRTRAEMRERGMLLPELPPDIKIEEEEGKDQP